MIAAVLDMFLVAHACQDAFCFICCSAAYAMHDIGAVGEL